MKINNLRLTLLLLLLQSVVASSQQNSSPSHKEPQESVTPSLPWDKAELFATPGVVPTDLCRLEGFESFFYEGLEYKASKTRIFAYYKKPGGVPPAGGWPAIICVHGGGGTAFPGWVQAWVDHGYAAIAMDLEGHLPQGKFPDREWHEKAGPPRITVFGDIELADREQWFFHAVADVIKANSLLRSFPDINKDKIGIHGISWGGVITSAVMGIDNRLSFAIPVYGCGFLHETTCPVFKKYFDVMTENQLKAYKSKWDPSVYLPYCEIPALFYIGSNDGAFPLDIWQKSALLSGGRRVLCMPVTSKHGHIWDQEELFAFADAVTGKGSPLLQIGEVKEEDGLAAVELSMDAESGEISVSSARLEYTRDTCDWQHRKWESIPATLKDKTVSAELPPMTKAFYFNVTDNRGLTFSSSYRDMAGSYK